MPEVLHKFTFEPTDDPHLFRVVDRQGDWTTYFHDEKKIYLPSVNFVIKGGFPKGDGLIKWLMNTSRDEAERTLERTGEKGSRVHEAIRELIDGQVIAIDRQYKNEITGRYEPLTDEEWDCLRAFVRWCEEYKPQVIKHETAVWTAQQKYRYAGTVDFYGTIELKGKRITALIDWKTGSGIYDDHKLQTAAYAKTYKKAPDITGILRLGSRHKCGYEFQTWDKKATSQHFEIFLASFENFEFTHPEIEPEQEEIPTQLAVTVPRIEQKTLKRSKWNAETPKLL